MVCLQTSVGFCRVWVRVQGAGPRARGVRAVGSGGREGTAVGLSCRIKLLGCLEERRARGPGLLGDPWGPSGGAGCSAPRPRCAAGLYGAVPAKPVASCSCVSRRWCVAGEDEESLLLSLPEPRGEPGQSNVATLPRSASKVGGRCHHLKTGDKKLRACTPLFWLFPRRQELTASADPCFPVGFGSCPQGGKGCRGRQCPGCGQEIPVRAEGGDGLQRCAPWGQTCLWPSTGQLLAFHERFLTSGAPRPSLRRGVCVFVGPARCQLYPRPGHFSRESKGE